MMVEGKGNIRLEIDGRNQTITDIYYVPGLKNNLISVGQLQQKGLRIVIDEGVCRIWHKAENKVIMSSLMSKNRMFTITAKIKAKTEDEMDKCLIAAETNDSLWHKRFGHMNYESLRTLGEKQMVKGFPKFTKESGESVCEICLRGKQIKQSIPKESLWRSTRCLQLVHTYICGPINPTSESGKRYIINFIDDFSRKCWTYFLSEKSEAFKVFKEFKAETERELGQQLACLRSDRGGEYNSNEFIEYCKNYGIRRQLTAAYTPQQNGLAERKNRSLLNMTRCMLIDGKVPRKFWPEAVAYAVYIQNRSPSKALGDITPEEKWGNWKPTVEHLRVFGSIAYALIPYEKRVKLDEKSIKCIMFGMSRESKAYRLFNPSTKKILISKDVKFDEEGRWDWENNQNERELTWEIRDSEGEEEEILLDETETQPRIREGGNKTVERNQQRERAESDQAQGAQARDALAQEGINDSQARDALAQEGIDDVENPRHLEETNRNIIRDEGESSVRGRTSVRSKQRPTWMCDYWTTDSGFSTTEENDEMFALLISPDDPENYEEAAKREVWRRAMEVEIRSIEDNKTWNLVEKPKDAKVIGVKWIFKTKLNEKGEVDKYKARLVAKGYHQTQGIDFQEVFAPVARWDTIRIILAVAAERKWKVFQLDVKSAFLHGELKEEVFVEQPKGFEVEGEISKVYKLKKALYGLKQAPRAWYSRIEGYFEKEGFTKCFCEHTLFVKREGEDVLIVSLYVDDLIYTGSSTTMMKRFKDSMMEEFSMSDLGQMKYFLGVEVVQDEKGIFLSQKKYAEEILMKFGLEGCNSVRNPIVPGQRLSKNGRGEPVDPTLFKQMVGSLRYLTVTRPDLVYSVNLVSRYMEEPREEHLLAVKRIMRYVQGSKEYGIRYELGGNQKLVGFVDSDYAGDHDDRKSTSGYVFLMGKGAVSWSSKKQPIVTLSTTEAEYVSAAFGACQAMWLRNVMGEVGFCQEEPTYMFCDNSSTIKLSKNPVMHGKSKHIDVRFHFLRNLVSEGTVQLVYCSTKDQLADIMTKAVKLETFEKLRREMGVMMRID